MQKKHPKYKEMVDDTAWTMTQLNEYLNAEVVAKSGGKCTENWALEVLPGKMKAIMGHVVAALKGTNTIYSFVTLHILKFYTICYILYPIYYKYITKYYR